MKNFLFFIFFPLFSTAQSTQTKQLIDYRKQLLPEKIYVHTDKNIYAAGETIWFALYAVDGQTHLPGAFSQLIRVALVDGQHQEIEQLELNAENGYSQGTLELPKKLKAGQYQLLAYTNYQLNSGKASIFRKSIQIIKGIDLDNTKLAVQSGKMSLKNLENEAVKIGLFPEGGDCIYGINCKMGIYATNLNGQPVEVQGILEDEQQKNITFFKTNIYGMGQLVFVPQLGKDYQLKAIVKEVEKNFALPKILPKGYHLQVEFHKSEVQLIVYTNVKGGLKNAKVVVHRRGLPFIEEDLTTSENATLIPIKKEDLESGVHTVTIFDGQNEPVAERLFFVAPSKKTTTIELSLAFQNLRPRQESILNLRVNAPEALPDSLTAGQLSLSILPEAAAIGLDKSDIRTWILLNSDLDFPIPCPTELLFNKNANARDFLINQFLMTRGWRRFRWKALATTSSFEPTHPLENGFYIKGIMKNFDSPHKPRPGKVFLTIAEHLIKEEVMTDEGGNFKFGPILVYDTTQFNIQGRFKLGKKNRLTTNITLADNSVAKLSLISNPLPKLPISPTCNKLEGESKDVQAYQTLSNNSLLIEKRFEGLSIDLEEVDIVAKRISEKEKEMQKRTRRYLTPTFRMIIDSIPGAGDAPDVWSLIRRLPGVLVIKKQVIIRRGSATVIVDDLEADEYFLDGLFAADIEFIDVLKGADAAIYGSGAVVLIYTRRGYSSESEKKIPGIIGGSLYGFHKAKEFAVFDPNAPGNQNRPDIRTTLHWNPKIPFNHQEKVQEQFSTSDQTGNFVIIAKGLRKDGQPLFGMTQFVVE